MSNEEERGTKRARVLGDDVDALIRAELAADTAAKMARKAGKGEPKPKGKTLAQIEEEEGGPVKESLLAVAQVKRAAARKPRKGKGGNDEDDVEMPDDVDRFEKEDVEVEEEGGVKFMAFSTKDDREAGDFDSSGNYVERKENRADKDAWLDSAEVVDEKTRGVIEARRKAEAEAEAAAGRQVPLTDRQIAQAKADIAAHMLEGESVTRALRRIRGSAVPSGAATSSAGGAAKPGRAMGKREKAKAEATAAAAAAGDGDAAAAPAAAGDLALFERLTDLTDSLFAEGETDVFTTVREELVRSAEMWLPKGSIGGASAGGAVPAAAAAVSGPAADSDDDMFGDDDGAAAAAPSPPAAAAAAPPAAAAPAASAQAQAPPQAPAAQQQQRATDFSSWPVKEILRFLKESGVDSDGIVEKGDLVTRAAKAEVDAASAQAAEVAQAAQATVPDGYTFDAASGYYHSAATGLYFEPAAVVTSVLPTSHTTSARAAQAAPTRMEDRAVGVMLGGMCGNVLGAELEGAPASLLQTLFPHGVTDFPTEAVAGTSPPSAQAQAQQPREHAYTVDTQMGIALARSLLEHGGCDPAAASASYAREFQPHRGYSETQFKILSDLKDGVVGWRSVATRHIPNGSYGNGGAMRIAPVGVAYRHATPKVLRKAVEDALVCTHVHPWGIDGAVVQVLHE
ncbi:hypothetical protein FOA52_009838 [Chlamydomonas sp. UWO 241]|nr:hypothetical protein FOA52_009838 [Chlamydomonas sp. UWO 241]